MSKVISLDFFVGISVLNLVWNPGFPGLFAVCLSNGSVSIMEMTETEVKTLATHPGNVKASASKELSSCVFCL